MTVMVWDTAARSSIPYRLVLRFLPGGFFGQSSESDGTTALPALPPLWHGHTAHSREVSILLVSALPSSGEGSTNDAEDASSVALMGRLYPDYFDIAYACFEGGFRDLIIAMAERGEAMAAPLFFVLELTLLSLLVAHVRWSRPLAKGKKFVGRAPPSWTLLVLAMDIGPYRAQAMAPGSRVVNYGHPTRHRGRQTWSCGVADSALLRSSWLWLYNVRSMLVR